MERLKDESTRLAALRSYGVLDTPSERDFDELAQLAADICEVPIALVSLVDQSRQWFKARVGLDVCETPRDVAFCAYAIQSHELLVVPDARNDPRFRDNPLVTGEPWIRFYAGAPLVTEDGVVLGTLCAIDRQPRELTARQTRALVVLSRQVVAQLELRRRAASLAHALAARDEHAELARLIIEQSGDGIMLADADGVMRLLNPEAERQHGVPHMPVPPDRWAETYGLRADDGAPLPLEQIPLYKALQGERVDGAPVRIRRPDGTERLLNVTASPLRRSDGTRAGAVLTSRDETERRRAELRLAEESRINETLCRLGTSFATDLDPRRLAQHVTDEATALTAAQFGAFIFFGSLRPGDSAPLPPAVAGARHAHLATTDPSRIPLLFEALTQAEGVIRIGDVRNDPWGECLDSTPFDPATLASYLAVPVLGRAGEAIAGLFFGHTEPGRFTAQHERVVTGIAAQASVALENARLYAAVRARELEARTASEAARRADQRKDEFLAVLGHELRNPLAPIVTALELMKMRDDGASREREIITRHVQHLLRLVDDLLDVSRITRGKIRLRSDRVELSEIVDKAVEMSSPLLEQRRHRLTLEVPRTGLPLLADAVRLAQVISNLLINAAKYTEPGGEIVVAATRQGETVQVSIRDNGIGISADVLQTVFEPFVQSERALDRADGGLGIGLTLVRSLVEMHRGTVAARSDGLGCGSEFTVTLPLATDGVDHTSASSAPVSPAPTREIRVLLVDDNEDAAEMHAEALHLMGYRVEVAHDGPSALALASRFEPQIAVLDIGLPVMDGFELARRLRQQHATVPMRLIALTGYGQDHDRSLSRAAGFDLHLVKPVDLDALLAAVAPPPV